MTNKQSEYISSHKWLRTIVWVRIVLYILNGFVFFVIFYSMGVKQLTFGQHRNACINKYSVFILITIGKLIVLLLRLGGGLRLYLRLCIGKNFYFWIVSNECQMPKLELTNLVLAFERSLICRVTVFRLFWKYFAMKIDMQYLPPKTTEWMAPRRTVASIAIIASGINGM